MCRPLSGSRAEVCPGGHIGRPLHGVEGIPNQREIGAKTDLANGAGQSPPPTGATEQGGLRRGVVTPPYGSATGDAQQRADVGIGPYGEKGKSHQPPRPAAHSGAFAVRMGGMGGNRSRDHPQNVQQRRTIPQSRPLAVPAPFPQGSLGGRGMRIAVTSAPNFGTKFGWRWLRPRRVGPAGLLAMTMVFCHSEERSDVGIRPFYDGRGFGPPGSSAPADAVWGVPRERHAGVVVPYGSMTGGAKRWADVGIGPYGSDVGNTQRRHDGPPGPAGATLVVPSGRGGRRECYVSSHWRE